MYEEYNKNIPNNQSITRNRRSNGNVTSNNNLQTNVTCTQIYLEIFYTHDSTAKRYNELKCLSQSINSFKLSSKCMK